MAVYATYPDVLARAGRWQTLFTVAGSHPNQADVEQVLADLHAQIDAAITARGHSPSGLTDAQRKPFTDAAAYGALARTLGGVPDSPDELADLVKRAERIWGQAMGDPGSSTAAGQKGTIAGGSHPGIAQLEAQGGASAGAFWGDEPAFGTPAQVEAEKLSLPAELAPSFAKSQTL